MAFYGKQEGACGSRGSSKWEKGVGGYQSFCLECL